jgi:hypothetical protein
MLRPMVAFAIAMGCIALTPWLASGQTVDSASDPLFKGGERIGREGNWTIFRTDRLGTHTKCVALHHSRRQPLLTAGALIVSYEAQGPLVAYRFQLDDAGPGAMQTPFAHPSWASTGSQSEFAVVLTA